MMSRLVQENLIIIILNLIQVSHTLDLLREGMQSKYSWNNNIDTCEPIDGFEGSL